MADGDMGNAARGFRVAQEVTLATVQGDEAAALAVIHGATPSELAWAVARLGGVAAALARYITGDDVDDAHGMLRNAFSDQGDLLDTQLRLMGTEDDA